MHTESLENNTTIISSPFIMPLVAYENASFNNNAQLSSYNLTYPKIFTTHLLIEPVPSGPSYITSECQCRANVSRAMPQRNKRLVDRY